jgi:hypothetical protein
MWHSGDHLEFPSSTIFCIDSNVTLCGTVLAILNFQAAPYIQTVHEWWSEVCPLSNSFCADWKFKMATTMPHSVTLESMQNMVLLGNSIWPELCHIM